MECRARVTANLPSLTGFEIMSVLLKRLLKSALVFTDVSKEDGTSEGAIKAKRAVFLILFFN